ncbi:MAG: hypothetical protein OSB00_00010 [Sphingomonas bacterium]|nr:hypothetical protein [Sphingomonas bacterium]
MAANTLDQSMWDGARRLAGVSQPEAWNAMLTGALIVQANREAIEQYPRAGAMHS